MNRCGYLLLWLVCLGMAGCASDPLTRTLKRLDYAPIIPVPKTQHIGDIYDTAELKNPPFILIRDLFAKEEVDAFMNSLEDEVSLPSVSGKKTFRLNAAADIVDQAEAELRSYGITKFKVRFGGAYQYLISRQRLEDELFPKIRRQLPSPRPFDGKYMIIALLKVSELEYEFFRDNSTKVSVASQGELEKVLQGKLGAEWKGNERQNISLNTPRFIGVKLARLKKVDDSDRLQAATVETVLMTPPYEFEELTVVELRQLQESEL